MSLNVIDTPLDLRGRISIEDTAAPQSTTQEP